MERSTSWGTSGSRRRRRAFAAIIALLAMAALEAAMDAWDGVAMKDVRREALRLGDPAGRERVVG